MSILRRLPPPDRFSVVERAWAGGTVVCIGGGPSLTPEQVEEVRAAGVRAIAVNDAYRIAPFADVCYFADAEWWCWHKDKPDFRAFAGQKCSIENSADKITDPAVHLLRNASYPAQHGFGLSLAPHALMTGRNSGFQALNLAILTGAATVILIGYDAREPGIEGKTHWFGAHPTREQVSAYAEYRRAFSAAEAAIEAAGGRVINCSPGSAINSFPKMALAHALRL